MSTVWQSQTLPTNRLSRGPSLVTIPMPYALFLGTASEPGWAKTAFGLRDWVPEHCIAEIAMPQCQVSLGLPRVTLAEAAAMGARSLVIGVAPIGGRIDPQWIPLLVDALHAGLDLVSGMHTRLGDVVELSSTATRAGRKLIEIRIPPPNIPLATGAKRSGQRLLTIGTDCALGKKYTALALTRAFRARGVDADFRATGQTGILIAGSGIPMDAVVSDFLAGAAEALSPDAATTHWDVIEGQGSLFHPSYAAVTLGLLHGSQPDVIVVCHDPRRREVDDCPGYLLPTIPETIALALKLGRRVNPDIRCAGVSLNTSGMSAAQADEAIRTVVHSCGLPAADPIRGGPALDALVSSCLGF
jgi:uncharacterized NAD-dependent epimerase/dehydratase family protein